MQKDEIINQISLKLNTEESKVEEIVNEFLDTICRSLQEEQGVVLRDFGAFRKTFSPERTGRNPATGAEITIPPRAEISFTSSAKLKKIINE